MAGIRCHRCGRTGDEHALDWSSTSVDGDPRRLCGVCTRHHVRDIEGKLEEDWWSPPTRPVLVVEDDVDTRLLIRMALESAGYSVDDVGSGEEAVERLESGVVPTALVLDVGLPGALDGWDVHERARRLVGDVPVIVISPEARPGERAPTGDVEFLRKPFEMELLVDLVGRRSGDQAGAGLA